MRATARESVTADGSRGMARPPVAPSPRRDEDATLTRAEHHLRGVLRILTFVFAAAAPLFLLAALSVSGQAGWAQVGFSVNSVTKVGALAGMAALAASNLRRFSVLVALLIYAHAVSVAAILAVLVGADTSARFSVLGVDMSLTTLLLGALIMDGGIGLMIAVLFHRARRARYELRYLPAMAFEALAALAEVVLPSGERRVAPEEVARRVDTYIDAFSARRRWIVPLALCGLWLYPLAFLRAPFPLIATSERRRFAEARFRREAAGRLHLARRLVRAMLRLAQQMVFLGYYGDPRTYESVGYTPFKQRDRFPAAQAKRLPHERLRTLSPDEIRGETLDADVVVVGSGAGGSTVAYRLAEAGRDVLLLEGGRHVDPSEFTDDEVHQIATLYSDGALQLSRDFSFQMLQGKCVGGSTTINNAVCFDLPDRVLERWNGSLEAGIDAMALRRSFAEVRRLIRVDKPPSEYLQAGWRPFADGVRALGLDSPAYRFGVVEANIADCPGTGYCNIGCPYGNKLSTLVGLLPQAQRMNGGDALRVLPRCEAVKIEHSGARATHVLATLDGRRLKVAARTIVISAGAIASPWLLMRSGIARGRAGRRLAVNMGSPITADFDRVLDSFDGVQISHFLEPPSEHGFVAETWFNPVVSQALNMPGWFDDHWHNMQRFRHLTAAGVLVGTTTERARVRRAWTGGPDVDFTPGRGDPRNVEDMRRLIEGLKLVGRIFLAAGANRVMPSTFAYEEFTDEAELERLDRYLSHPGDLSVGTGHPQGGNAISADPRRGVVGPDCRVHGFDNLFVCDASVFPSATTVNPQLTVMAIADMAAPTVAAAG
jgi:choline dehydrogenase-like flavoprotein